MQPTLTQNACPSVHAGHPISSLFDRLEEVDPTGEVDLLNPAAVAAAICKILDRRYGGRYDAALLRRAVADVVRAYRGEYAGLLRCDTLYHDLRHALEAGLTMARLLDGHAACHALESPAGNDAEHALLGILLALFHDIGLLRRESEAHLWGPELTPVHEERSIEFVQSYLADTTLAALAGEAELIMATKLMHSMPATWSEAQRTLASLIGTADLISQVSDRCYLEKCRDFLFLEFGAFGLAGKPDSPYPDPQTLLAKTPAFVEGFLYRRLDEELQGARRYLRVHMGGDADPWQEAMQRNLGFLKALLGENELNRLRRHPAPYIGDLT